MREEAVESTHGEGEQVLLALGSDVPAKHLQEKFQEASRFLRRWSPLFVPWKQRGTSCSIYCKTALQISDTGTLEAVEGISNAGGRRDIEGGDTSQLRTQHNTLYRAVKIHSGRLVVICKTTMRNQGVDLQHARCLAAAPE